MKIKRFAAVFLVVLGTQLFAVASQSLKTSDFELSGFNEVVLIVSDLKQYQNFFQNIGGYKTISESRLDQDSKTLWQLPEQAMIKEVLLKNPGTESGLVRLIKIDGVKQRQIRSNTQSWDTGGIFDINVRVLNMEKKFAQLQALGWQSVSDPVQFEFGPFVVKEWIVRGPDGITLALIERIKPKLENWPHIKEFSRVFNSTQTVRNIEKSRHFYQQTLGFKPYIEHKGPSEKATANVLGLPYNLAPQIDRSISILHPQGINEGSVEILQFHGATGRDVSVLAKAPNLGIVTLRFPVKGLIAFKRYLKAHHITIRAEVNNMTMAPYGKINIIVIQTPDGNLLEFYEPII